MSARPPLPVGPYLLLGLARSGLAAGLALRARGLEVIAVDQGNPPGAHELAAAGAEVHLQTDGLELLDRARTLLKSPGVPAGAPAVRAARARGIEVIGELELAWRLLGNEFLGVTGTNGKTTTVHLIGQIYREAALPYALAGNVGTAASSLAGSLAPDATVICEVSSFQLEDATELAPETAVLLNVTPDHLDRHATMASYLQAKLSIFARQGRAAAAVLPAALARSGARLADGTSVPPLPGHARRVTFGAGPDADLALVAGSLAWRGSELVAASELRLRGPHNLENAMAAAAACLARGIAPEAVRSGLRGFAGVPHRLEEIGLRDGVLYVNDSKATNVSSTLVALDTFAAPETQGRVHLILGGRGKQQDFSSLRAPVASVCAAAYLIGEDARAIAATLREGWGESEPATQSNSRSSSPLARGADPVLELCGDLSKAVSRARAAASSGDVILLSPACASFDQFEDFEARGRRFRELVG